MLTMAGNSFNDQNPDLILVDIEQAEGNFG